MEGSAYTKGTKARELSSWSPFSSCSGTADPWPSLGNHAMHQGEVIYMRQRDRVAKCCCLFLNTVLLLCKRERVRWTVLLFQGDYCSILSIIPVDTIFSQIVRGLLATWTCIYHCCHCYFLQKKLSTRKCVANMTCWITNTPSWE